MIIILLVPIEVGYNSSVYKTAEKQQMVELNITIFEPQSGGSPRPFNVSISTHDGTASMIMIFCSSNNANEICHHS